MAEQPHDKPTPKLPREVLVEVPCAAALLGTGAIGRFLGLLRAE
jgi:hypothetical protein